MLLDQQVGFAFQLAARGARDEGSYAAAMREVAVRRVDDGVDRLFQEVPANYLERSFLD
jgi:hypothetical protein